MGPRANSGDKGRPRELDRRRTEKRNPYFPRAIGVRRGCFIGTNEKKVPLAVGTTFLRQTARNRTPLLGLSRPDLDLILIYIYIYNIYMAKNVENHVAEGASVTTAGDYRSPVQDTTCRLPRRRKRCKT